MANVSDVATATGIAPARTAAKPAAETNVGVYTGRVVALDRTKAGKHVDRRNGREFELQDDRYSVTVGQTGGRLKFDGLTDKTFDQLRGGDLIEVRYLLAGSRMDGLFRAVVQGVRRLERGDGKFPSRGEQVFQDMA